MQYINEIELARKSAILDLLELAIKENNDEVIKFIKKYLKEETK